MANVTIELPSMLSSVLGGVRRLEAKGDTWATALEDAFRKLPSLRVHVVDETGAGSPFGIGIVLADSSQNVVVGNRMTRVPVPFTSHTGLLLFGSSGDNLVISNQVFNHTASGFRVSAGAFGNRFYFNEGTGSTPWDADDQNPECDDTLWIANSFATFNPPCVDAWRNASGQ